MDIGLLTAPFGKDMDFQQIAERAGKAGFTALEVTAGSAARASSSPAGSRASRRTVRRSSPTSRRCGRCLHSEQQRGFT